MFTQKLTVVVVADNEVLCFFIICKLQFIVFITVGAFKTQLHNCITGTNNIYLCFVTGTAGQETKAGLLQ